MTAPSARPVRPVSPWRAVVAPGVEAFRTYWKLFIGIQMLALGLVVLYYQNETFRAWCSVLGEWKTRGGLLAAALGTVISGGVLPELLKWRVRPAHLPSPTWGELCHQAGYFAVAGVMVDLFYRLQAHLFGTQADAGTIIVKLVVDQLVYTPLVAMPFTVTWFLWREHNYRLGAALRAWSPRLYRERALPLWATALSYWPVMVTLIYSLPAPVQFPLFLCANSAWALLLVFMARRQVEQKAR